MILLLYTCREWRGIPHAIEAADVRWVTIAEMRELEMPPADVPLIGLLEKLL